MQKIEIDKKLIKGCLKKQRENEDLKVEKTNIHCMQIHLFSRRIFF